MFYHTQEFPDGETVEGNFDLRAGVDDYIGNLDYNGKRVIEIGPASGVISFAMEERGADVVSIDLPVDGNRDIVPYAGVDQSAVMVRQMSHLEKVRNSYLVFPPQAQFQKQGHLPQRVRHRRVDWRF